MRYAELPRNAVFRFLNEGIVRVYEKVNDTHYRRGISQINNICQPITNRPLGSEEPVTADVTIYPDKRYLGDSVYVEMEGDSVKLTTENGRGASNTILLEEHVMNKLCRYWDDVIKVSNS